MRKLTPSGAPPSTHWYETAGLGMFLHWGLSSVRAVGDLSWCMIKDTPYDAELENRNKLTPEEYWSRRTSSIPTATTRTSGCGRRGRPASATPC